MACWSETLEHYTTLYYTILHFTTLYYRDAGANSVNRSQTTKSSVHGRAQRATAEDLPSLRESLVRDAPCRPSGSYCHPPRPLAQRPQITHLGSQRLLCSAEASTRHDDGGRKPTHEGSRDSEGSGLRGGEGEPSLELTLLKRPVMVYT